jgi:acetoin utilization deacetylase AcuC-like enzyme
LPEYATLLSGAAIQSANLLLPNNPQDSSNTDETQRPYDIVINWDGGRHHATRSRAVGYCYIADIPLSILTLLHGYKRVLYVDLDAHHGDGVEDAFRHSQRVGTLSFHVFEPGFFPGTGETGGKRGKWNVGLERGLKGVIWEGIVVQCLDMVWREFGPDCVVVQCGCDG